MTLRAQLALDRATFLNPEEFGEEIVIDGVAVTAVRDDDLIIERTQGPRAEGAFAKRRVFHLASGLITTPVEGQRVDVGDARWYVEQVSEAEGMLELTLLRQET